MKGSFFFSPEKIFYFFSNACAEHRNSSIEVFFGWETHVQKTACFLLWVCSFALREVRWNSFPNHFGHGGASCMGCVLWAHTTQTWQQYAGCLFLRPRYDFEFRAFLTSAPQLDDRKNRAPTLPDQKNCFISSKYICFATVCKKPNELNRVTSWGLFPGK